VGGRAEDGDVRPFAAFISRPSELAAMIRSEDRKPVWIGERRQWYFTVSIRIPKVDHPVRIVILWDRKNGREAAKMMVTNRTYWEVTRTLMVYRKRWTGTETFHPEGPLLWRSGPTGRDGKQHLGMGDCQVRKGEGQTRHMHLVMLSHGLAVAEMRQGRAREWARSTLTTVGEACRAMLRETLGKALEWALERVTVDGWEVPRVKTALSLA
jgi:hypothetical protein